MYEIYEKLLKGKGVRTADVCRATGIRSSTMTDWKKGRSTPKADKLKLIADYFGVDISTFYDTLDVPESEQPRYYIDGRTAEIAQKIFDSRDLRLLFDAAIDASPDDLHTTYAMLMALRKKESH